MSKILSRDNFINEVYTKRYSNNVNEGFFEFLKGLLKKQGWDDVKCSNEIIKSKLEELDNKLNGFTLTKMQYPDKCQNVRQGLVMFAETLYAAKQEEYEQHKKLEDILFNVSQKDEVSDKDKKNVENASNVSAFIQKFSLTDKTYIEKLKNAEKRINDACDGQAKVTKWANILKNDISDVINDALLAWLKKDKADKMSDAQKKELEDKLKEQEKAEKDRLKEIEKKNKQEKQREEQATKKLEIKRQKVLKDNGVKAITQNSARQVNVTISKYFNKIMENLNILFEEEKSSEEDKSSIVKIFKFNNNLKNDKVLGLQQLATDKNISPEQKGVIATQLYNVNNTIDDIIKKNKNISDKLKDLPGDSLQAFYVGVCKMIVYAVTGDENYKNDDIIELMARCSMSDKIIGYNLPVIDENHPEKGNLYTEVVRLLLNDKIYKSSYNDNSNYKLFKDNIQDLADAIKVSAKKLKKKQEQENEKENEKELQDQEKTDKDDLKK